MKKFIGGMILTCLISTTYAQFSVGPKLGLNANIANTDNSTVKVDPIVPGFYAGLFGNYEFAKPFSVQVELLYSQEGSKYKFKGDPTVYTDKLSYLDIPVLFQFKTRGGFYLETGPQLGLLLSANESGDGESQNIKGYTSSTKFSWDFGLGVQIAHRVGLGLRYAYGFSNVSNSDVSGGSIKDNVLSIGLSYAIHVGK